MQKAWSLTPGVLLCLQVSACIASHESSKLTFKGSVAESSEEVTLDPVFLARQKHAEQRFFGFSNSETKSDSKKTEPSAVQDDIGTTLPPGALHLSYDSEDGEADVTPEPSSIQDLKPSAAFFASVTGIIWPLDNPVISSPFGMRRGRLHAGIDIRSPKGSPIRAVANGQVLLARRKGAYGKVVVIAHNQDHQSLYAHMLELDIPEGQYVRKGDILGTVGRTGRATGYHLHFETRVAGGIPQNPIRFLPSLKAKKRNLEVGAAF